LLSLPPADKQSAQPYLPYQGLTLEPLWAKDPSSFSLVKKLPLKTSAAALSLHISVFLTQQTLLVFVCFFRIFDSIVNS
jgi:hypothetical protein